MSRPRRDRSMTEADWARIASVNFRHLIRLAAIRHYRGVLPDDWHGRCMLKALLACGMTGPDAQRWAPWISAGELQHMINDVDATPPQHWTAQRLGELVELTDDEREAGRLWSMHPCDIEWSAVQARAKERRRGRDRVRKHKKREQEKMANDLDVREESLIAVLGNAWTPVLALVTKLAGGRAWRGPDGRPVSKPSLRIVVHRSLDRLVASGLIESKTEPGHNGWPTRFVRLRDLEGTRFVTGNHGNGNSRPQVNARNARQMGTSAPSEKVPPRSEKKSPRILKREATHL
jgi:DNA-binding XRE family transcriptional regulator